MNFEGSCLDGRYKIVRKLGAGGMAVVYLAEDLEEKRKVAVKIMPPSGASADEFVRRFRREFAVCSRFDHPNIVKLYSWGKTPQGAYYYAMEYLDCPTLEDLLVRSGRLKQSFVLQMVLQIGRAFAHYFSKNIVHRDLKPGNIMVEPNGRVVVMDFGLVLDPSMTQLTATGCIMGTPQYMSPELLMGESVDFRSDIFQLGTIVHECLCGRKAFTGRTVPEVGHKIMNGIYTPLRKIMPSISRSWENLVLNCLAHSREDRYQSATPLLEDVQKLMMGLEVDRLPVSAVTAPTEELSHGIAGETFPLAHSAVEPQRSGTHRLAQVKRDTSSPDIDPGDDMSKRDGAGRTAGVATGGRLHSSGVRRQGGALSTGGAPGMTDSGPISDTLTGSGVSGQAALYDTLPPESLRRQRYFLVACSLAAALIIPLVLVLTGSSQEGYSCRRLSVRAGIETLLVRWTSERPYPSVVEISGRQGTKTFEGKEDGGSVTGHEVLVTGLEPDSPYQYRIVYPDGSRSLAKNVRTKRFEVSPVSFGSGKGPRGPWKFVWRCSPKISGAKLRMVFDGVRGGTSTAGDEQWRTVRLSEDWKHPEWTLCKATLDDFRPGLRDIELRVILTSGGSIKASVAQALGGFARGMIKRLSSLRPMDIVSGTIQYMQGAIAEKFDENLAIQRPGESDAEYKARKKSIEKRAEVLMRRRCRKGAAIIEARLTGKGYIETFRRLAPVSGLIFGSSMVPFRNRRDLYRNIVKFHQLYAYTAFEDVPLSELKPFPDLGLWNLEVLPPSGIDGKLVIFDARRDGRMEFALPRPWDRRPYRKRFWRGRFVLEEDPKNLSYAAITLAYDQFKNLLMWVDVNGKMPVLLYDEPILKRRRKGSAVKFLCAGIPVEALDKGVNSVSFTLDPCLGRISSQNIDCFRIAFVYRKKAGLSRGKRR